MASRRSCFQRNLVLSLVGVVVLTSCNSDAPKMAIVGPGSGSAPSQVDSGGSSADVLSIDEAGARYLDIVNPVNCAVTASVEVEKAHSLGNGTVDPAYLGELTSAWGRVAAARQTAYRELLDTTWPPEVAAEIDLMARDWSKVAQLEQGVANSYDVGSFNFAAQQVLNFPITSNPGIIRAKLNLAPATETDHC